ncbi:MAG TPA: hypothetical protein VEP90_08350 [Methylomirabilota bacterium]|nr:hypothetical protein [Methylomirabilota bacterium]
MTVHSKPVIFVVISFLALALIYVSISIFYVSAKPNYTNIECTKNAVLNPGGNQYSCCYGEVNSVGALQHWYCATCFKNAEGSLACGDYGQVFRSGGSNVLASPTGNNTVTLPLAV